MFFWPCIVMYLYDKAQQDAVFISIINLYVFRADLLLIIRRYYSVYRCPKRNGQNFGRVFLMLNYTDITQNTYFQS